MSASTTAADPHSLTSFSIYEDESASELSETHDQDTINSPHDSDLPIASVEDEAIYTAKPTSNRRRTSGFTGVSMISEFPPSESYTSGEDNIANAQSPYPSLRNRPPFRNPSSVRAMQMSSPPPFENYTPLRDQIPHRISTSSFRSETPRSVRRSQSIQKLAGDDLSLTQLKQARSPTPSQQSSTRQRMPLVLLHVTLLPLNSPYSATALAAVLPTWLAENFQLIEGKLADAVLMSRGLLIPHPRDEYDLLEERLLENLELTAPRLLKCGHFRLDDDDYGSVLGSEGSSHSRKSSASFSGHEVILADNGEVDDDASTVCADCNRHSSYSGSAIGCGKKRWEVKIYAANGLMRAGAWNAAWSEMERIDVEISPWVPEDVKRSLQEYMKKEQEDELLKKAEAAEAKRRSEEERLIVEQARIAEKLRKKLEGERDVDKKKNLEDGVSETNTAKDILPRSTALLAAAPAPETTVSQSALGKENLGLRGSKGRTGDDIPLTTLLTNYAYLLAQDRRNIVIFMLGLFICYLMAGTHPSREDAHSTGNLVPVVTAQDVFLPSIANANPAAIEYETKVATVLETATSTQTEVITTTSVVVQIATETVTTSVIEISPTDIPTTDGLAVEPLSMIEQLKHTGSESMQELLRDQRARSSSLGPESDQASGGTEAMDITNPTEEGNKVFFGPFLQLPDETTGKLETKIHEEL